MRVKPLPTRTPLGNPKSRATLARVFHALSDETRLQIVERLLTGERCVCDMAELLSAGQSRLSFHLKTLKDAGLVVDRREGRWVYYSLDPGTLAELREVLGELCSNCC